jgi:hypothetical protein
MSFITFTILWDAAVFIESLLQINHRNNRT